MGEKIQDSQVMYVYKGKNIFTQQSSINRESKARKMEVALAGKGFM